MIGATWRSKATQALLGPDRSPLVPSTLWVGYLDSTGALIAMSGTTAAASGFEPLGDGVTNSGGLDCGASGTGWHIAAVGLFDAAAGDLVVSAALVDEAGTPTTVSPTAGDPISFAAGALVFHA